MNLKNKPIFSWMMSALVLTAIILTSAIDKKHTTEPVSNAHYIPEKVSDDPCIGEIRMFGFNYAPRGWAFCNGGTLPIAENTALFSIIGTIYGGDGRTTMGLPNLQGRAAIGQGHGAGLSTWNLGQNGGYYDTTIGLSTSGEVKVGSPGRSGNTTTVTSATLSPSSSNITQPYQVISYCIALQGLYCSRS